MLNSQRAETLNIRHPAKVSVTAIVSRGRGPRALAAVAATILSLLSGMAPPVHADDTLPVYTSPTEITRGRIQLRAVAPDRDTGQQVDVPLPVGLLGPKMNKIMSTPLGAQMDEFWSTTPDPNTGMTPRQRACEEIKDRVQQSQIPGSELSVYDVSCNLATTGIVVTDNVGSTRYVSYQLLNNTVDFFVTTPATCHRGHGTFLCPDDPHFSVTFASEISTAIRTPALCQLTAERVNGNLHAVQIDTHNFSGDVIKNIVDTLFLDNKFSAAELAMEAVQVQVPSPLDGALKELRESAPCTDRSSPAASVLAAFSELDTTIDRGDVVIRAIHPTIAAPRFQNVSLPYGPDTCVRGFVWRDAFEGDHVCVTPETRSQAASDNAQAAERREPNGGAYGPNTCKQGFVWREARPEDFVCVPPGTRSQTAADNAQASERRVIGAPEFPSFARPNITAQPIVGAGNSLTVNGQFFPPNLDPTRLLLSLERDTTSACNGGATELESAPAGGQKHVQRLPSTSNVSSCASGYEASNLTTATAYQFRARDCDMVTCSAWSAPLSLTTAAVDTDKGKVLLTLDGGTQLGTATISDQGTFEASVTVPAGTTAGTHTIQAVNGSAKARASLEVTTSGSGGSRATILLTGRFYGETGCPTHPLPDYGQSVTTDETFSLFGTGFAPGTVTIELDSATGMSMGTATVRADGSFCQDDLMGPPTSQLGSHTLVAVQNGAVLATVPVRVVPPYVLH